MQSRDAAGTGDGADQGNDRVAIAELIFRYAYLTDHNLHDRVSTEIFAEDAVIRTGGGLLSGREAIHDYYLRGRDSLAAMAHLYGNLTLHVEGDRARSCCYVTTWMWSHGTSALGPVRPADVVAIGMYVDDVRRTPEGWRISARTMHPLGPSGLASGSPPDALHGLFEELVAIGPSDVSSWPR